MKGRRPSATLRLAAAAVAFAVYGSGAAAQARATPLQNMAQEARVSRDAARMTALSKVPGGRMSSIELRRGVGGKLVYTALITEPGKTNKTEVVIDAMTGAMISKRP
ncbi:MAG: PepSY domain-containing protein [Gemmatimonadaceae bacterium]|nr:PepSY domain-containing protein [Gemmatimonadaceae bacterium]